MIATSCAKRTARRSAIRPMRYSAAAACPKSDRQMIKGVRICQPQLPTKKTFMSISGAPHEIPATTTGRTKDHQKRARRDDVLRRDPHADADHGQDGEG